MYPYLYNKNNNNNHKNNNRHNNNNDLVILNGILDDNIGVDISCDSLSSEISSLKENDGTIENCEHTNSV